MKKMNKKGFTIVELVIVIAVIAILAAVLIPTFSGIVEKAQKSAVLQEARNLYTEVYADDLGDGVVDGNSKKDTPVVVTEPTGVTAEYTPDQTIKFSYAKGDWKAQLNGSAWEVVEN